MSRVAHRRRERDLARGLPHCADAIVIADAFGKKTQATPTPVIDACKRRLRAYDAAVGGKE